MGLRQVEAPRAAPRGPGGLWSGVTIVTLRKASEMRWDDGSGKVVLDAAIAQTSVSFSRNDSESQPMLVMIDLPNLSSHAARVGWAIVTSVSLLRSHDVAVDLHAIIYLADPLSHSQSYVRLRVAASNSGAR